MIRDPKAHLHKTGPCQMEGIHIYLHFPFSMASGQDVDFSLGYGWINGNRFGQKPDKRRDILWAQTVLNQPLNQQSD